MFIDNGKDAHCIFVDGSSKKTWFYGDIAVDTIVEYTGGAGVNIEGLDVEDSNLAMTGSSITQNITDADNGLVIINYTGYNGGTTRFRDFNVRDGKQATIIYVDGSTKETDFYGDIGMNDNDISGCNVIKATTSQDLTFQITSGRAIIWQTV